MEGGTEDLRNLIIKLFTPSMLGLAGVLHLVLRAGGLHRHPHRAGDLPGGVQGRGDSGQETSLSLPPHHLPGDTQSVCK